MPPITYNERSWGIDIISEINLISASTNRAIKKAGGEFTISRGSPLFPDVLLFSDAASASYLQGWELKFPDTSITDANLIQNAEKKAKRLGLNSFLLWNVTQAVLYIDDGHGRFVANKYWNELAHIQERNQVQGAASEWKILLRKIIDELNDFFDQGVIKQKTIIDAFSEGGVVDFICSNEIDLANTLKNRGQQDARFDAMIHLWWIGAELEYPQEKLPWNPLAKSILISWFNKFIFAHILGKFFSAAKQVGTIDATKTPTDAANIFENISTSCDFLPIFKQQIVGAELLPTHIWNYFIEFNAFLSQFSLLSVDQHFLCEILEKTISFNNRKSVGQFATPAKLAELLVRLTIDDKTKQAWDGCCGSGTIARAICSLKREYNISDQNIAASTWASDKYAFPIQLTALSLAAPANMGAILNVFQEDILRIAPNQNITLKDPNTGNPVNKAFPRINYFVSNLPFVKQESLHVLFPDLDQINAFLQAESGLPLSLDGRSDLYAYLILHVWKLLDEAGSAGIIISNSWLATEFGVIFRNILEHFFEIRYLITSGKGRWFANADVVTNILILKKKTLPSPPTIATPPVSFITTYEDLNNIANTQTLSSKILTASSDASVSIETYARNEIIEAEECGLEWSALFANVKWLPQIKNKLVKASTLFTINRGERRGWDPLFFPPAGHNIETDYIQPVLKSFSSVSTLTTSPSDEAFCCSKSIQELSILNHLGALSWINRFQHTTNEKGIPLPTVLQRARVHWYELSPNTLADLVTSVNPYERIFIARLSTRAFVNQRLIRFTLKDSSNDIELLHALSNSLLGIFFIEALGFGRGLGALDLTPTKLKNSLMLLNPSLLSPQQITSIKLAFAPLMTRAMAPIPEELLKPDRIFFENAVLSAYGLLDQNDNILSALRHLYTIRMSVS